MAEFQKDSIIFMTHSSIHSLVLYFMPHCTPRLWDTDPCKLSSLAALCSSTIRKISLRFLYLILFYINPKYFIFNLLQIFVPQCIIVTKEGKVLRFRWRTVILLTQKGILFIAAKRHLRILLLGKGCCARSRFCWEQR